MVDFSRNSKNMVNYAMHLFHEKNVAFTLLNVYKEPDPGSSLLVDIHDILEHDSKLSLEHEKKRIISRFKIPEELIITKSKNGSLSKIINQMCSSNHFDVAIMGCRGRSNLRSRFFGSNTVDVLRKAKLPVIIVPHYYSFKLPIKFGFGYDFNSSSSINSLDFLKKLLQIYSAHLQIVNIVVPSFPSGQSIQINEYGILSDFLGEIPHSFFDYQSDQIPEGIIDFVNENQIDLLILIAHKHHLLERIIRKSVTENVSSKINIPLLVIKDSK